MKDFLTDIVSHTHSLGIELVKIIGDNKTTMIESVTENRSLILKATFNAENSDFVGVFGMPNLDKLNTILNIPEYKEDAKITVSFQSKDGQNVPVGLHFENSTGDFKNDYRFMATDIINDKIKTVKFKGTTWNLSFTPTVNSIVKFKYQQQANKDAVRFTTKTENNNLVFMFGDHSNHAGSFVFHSNVNGKLLNDKWSWPVGIFQSILNLQGDKVVHISDDGVAKIEVNSGLINYEYLIPAS